MSGPDALRRHSRILRLREVERLRSLRWLGAANARHHRLVLLAARTEALAGGNGSEAQMNDAVALTALLGFRGACGALRAEMLKKADEAHRQTVAARQDFAAADRRHVAAKDCLAGAERAWEVWQARSD